MTSSSGRPWCARSRLRSTERMRAHHVGCRVDRIFECRNCVCALRSVADSAADVVPWKRSRGLYDDTEFPFRSVGEQLS